LGDGHDESFWQRFCSALRAAGYDDVLSIEHEDSSLDPIEGIRKSVAIVRPD
jgi:sugar phosphate isomerase/epimerase